MPTKSAIAVLCAAASLGLAATPLAAATLCVNPGGTGGCFSTIGAAIAAADATVETDTIDVAAGTYAELAVIPASEDGLTINGPNAGINPCTDTRGAEAIVGTAVSPSGAFQVAGGADDATIDGFTIQGVTGGPADLAAGVHALGSSGTRVVNNIVQNNVIGIAIGGSDVLVQFNDVRDNNNAGSSAGTGVYSDTGLTGSTIDGNCFTGHQNQTTLLIGSPIVAAAVTDVTLSNNTATSDSGFAFFGGSNHTVTGNSNVDNTIASSYFLGSVAGAVVNENLSLNGSFSGIRVNDGGAGASTGITASCNRLVGHDVAAINVEAGTHTGTLPAENNWFGCNEGPGNPGCDVVIGDVDFDPWLVLTFEVDPALVPSGGGSALLASLNANSDGLIAPCSVPDGTPVAFASTCGPVNPAFTSTIDGEASATVTGGPIGLCEVSATVDNETVAQQVQVVALLAAIPTASTVGMMLLGLGLAALALFKLRG